MLIFNNPVYSQNKLVRVTTKSGTVVKGEIKELDALDHITIIVAGVDTRLPMSEVAFVEQLDASHSTLNETFPNKVKVVVKDRLANYKGFLLEKGNNVYVYGATPYEKAAAEVIKTALKNDGFWNVVDNMNDAHFTFSYIVNLNWSDKALLIVSSWRSGSSKQLTYTGSNESESENRRIARKFYLKTIVPLQKKILKGSVPNSIIENFTIE